MREIALTQGGVALVDDEDYPLLARRRWRLRRCNGKLYAVCEGAIRGQQLYMHRVVLDAPVGLDVDHRNGDGLDNQRKNLRLASRTQNLGNQVKTRGASRFKGVSPARRGRWQGHIAFERKQFNLGTFDSEEGAARAYDLKARELFGEFARINGVAA